MSLNDHVIREATLDDLPSLIAMFAGFIEPSNAAKVLDFSYFYFTKKLTEWIESPTDLVLYHPNGFMICFICPNPYSDDKIASEFIWWVDPQFNNQGIGKALHERFEEWAKASGCNYCSCGVGSAWDTSKHTSDYLIRSGYIAAETNFMKKI